MAFKDTFIQIFPQQESGPDHQCTCLPPLLIDCTLGTRAGDMDTESISRPWNGSNPRDISLWKNSIQVISRENVTRHSRQI